MQAKTFKETAEQFGVSVSTMMRRFDRLAVKEMTEVQELPKVIVIDEYKGRKILMDYCRRGDKGLMDFYRKVRTRGYP